MIIQGMCYKYGDDINTDVIYPGRYTYLTLSDEEIASHALEDLDPTFAQRVQPGDILVGGWNWGVGSAREQAVKCLVFKGVRAIIAKSFARIYFRNCLNEGLLAIACPEAAQAAVDGEKVTIDLTRSEIIIGQQNFAFEPVSYTHLESFHGYDGLLHASTLKMKQFIDAFYQGFEDKIVEYIEVLGSAQKA